MIGIVTIAAMISATTTMTATMTIMIGIGRMTLRGGRAATDQLTTSSTLSNLCPSATMWMLIPRSFRVPA
jgi:hypothetical protein